jgi:hypothetical protein
VLDTCGVDLGTIPRFANSGMFSKVDHSGAMVSFGSAITTATGGQYRLCWCANSYACSIGENFRTDAGELTLIGVHPLMQDRTCVSGQTCFFDGLTGQHLSSFDQVMVLDTCGAQTVPPRFTHAGLLVSMDASGAQVTFGTTAVTAQGGQYRLCWCGGIPPEENNTRTPLKCSIAEHFRTDAGRMTLIGVAPLTQDRTCVSGHTCRIDGLLGQDLSVHDRLFVLETCGTVPVLPRFEDSGMFYDIKSTGAIVSWGTVPITAAGGQYRMCWCRETMLIGNTSDANLNWTSCSTTEHFRVDTGRFTLIGVAPLEQHRTCISGASCAIDGILGHHLQDIDSVIVLDTCGTFGSIPRFPRDAVRLSMSASGASASWSDVLVTAAGGQYQLCWCPGLQPVPENVSATRPLVCSTSEHFKVTYGILDLIGVSPLYQDRTCVSGQTCRIDGLQGWSLSATDRLAILDTCGVLETVLRLPDTGLSQPLSLRNKTDEKKLWNVSAGLYEWTYGAFSWGSVALTGAGGTYRLCWCAGGLFHGDLADLVGNQNGTLAADPPVVSTPRVCRPVVGTGNPIVSTGNDSAAVDFAVDAGALILVGPAPLRQHRTCVSGQTCLIDGITGQHLQNGDEVLILDTCNTDSTVPRFTLAGSAMTVRETGATVTWGTVAISSAGGQYRLCWCAGAEHSCTAAENFKTDFGALELVGPSDLLLRGERLSLQRTCVSGQTCA